MNPLAHARTPLLAKTTRILITLGLIVSAIAPLNRVAEAAPLAHMSFTISPQAGPPGTNVTVNGVGYALNTPIAVILYRGQPIAHQIQAYADSSGRIRVTLPIPSTVTPGTWKVATSPIYRGQSVSSQANSLMSHGLGSPFNVTATTPTVAASPAANTNSAAPYGGDCHGPGCVHPDLRAYGGSGPFGAAGNRSVHINYDRAQYHWVVQLTPSTSITTLEQRCRSSAQHPAGRLVVLDDAPWYYYFTGHYALIGCAR